MSNQSSGSIVKHVITFAYIAALFFAAKYFFFSKSPSTQETMSVSSADFFAAPSDNAWQHIRPLNTHIENASHKPLGLPALTDVETKWGMLQFSSHGAVLERVGFKGGMFGLMQTMYTVFPTNVEEDEACFLIALDHDVPYDFTLVKNEQTDDATELVYEATTESGLLRKRFDVNNNFHKIDVTVTFIPKTTSATSGATRLRLLFPNPVMPSLTDADTVSLVSIMDGTNSVEKNTLTQVKVDRGFITPSLIGLENRYFLHALVSDAEKFAQRAYIKKHSVTKSSVILESAPVTQETSWHMQFYMGPKQVDALTGVSAHLDNIMDYKNSMSILAPVSYWLLRGLNWLYFYVHNYGLAIILLTLLIKLIFFPLVRKTKKQEKTQKEFQRKLAYVQSRYKNDPDALNRERAELIRQHGLGGMGMQIIPMLFQIPIMITLSRVLSNSVELYRAPMLWISDLSARDPYYVLPIILAIGMTIQAFRMEPSQRTTFLVVACVATAIAVNVAAGLALYMALTTILGLLQTEYEKRSA